MKLFLKYSAVGAVNTGVSFGIIFILIVVFGFNYLFANFIGYIVGIFVSFTLNKYYTFSMTSKNTLLLFKDFLIVFMIAYSISQSILYIIVSKFGLDEIQGTAFAMLCYLIIGFLLNKKITFKERK